jgi:uncharacterized protein with HEPN domain
MFNEVYQYSLETILEHIKVCNKRFSEIEEPSDFISTEYGQILLDAIVTRFQAVGENLKNIFRKHTILEEKYPEIEWSKIIRFRDFIPHHYEMLDYEIVFEIGKNYLPNLQSVIEEELKRCNDV